MSAELIELGLSKAGKMPDLRINLAAVVERLGALIMELPVESERLKTAEFQTQLEGFQARIISAPNNDVAQTTLMSCLAACQEYFKRAGSYIVERETELNEVIKVLREAIAELAGEANSFHGNLLSTTERFSQMAKIEDIRHIRNALTQEVSELKKIVAEKQKKDQASYSRLTKRIDGLQSKLNKAKEEATLDPLTRIANRGGFDSMIKRWIAEHRESEAPLVLAMLDIDDFKKINDTHGHQIGDRVLVCAAQWLTSNIRAEDMAARYGGEEFAVLLANVKLKQAESKFTNLLERIAESNYQYNKGNQTSTIRFTFSCGLSEFSPGDSPEALIERADEALYQAKKNGKNQVKLKSKSMLRGFFGS